MDFAQLQTLPTRDAPADDDALYLKTAALANHRLVLAVLKEYASSDERNRAEGVEQGLQDAIDAVEAAITTIEAEIGALQSAVSDLQAAPDRLPAGYLPIVTELTDDPNGVTQFECMVLDEEHAAFGVKKTGDEFPTCIISSDGFIYFGTGSSNPLLEMGSIWAYGDGGIVIQSTVGGTNLLLGDGHTGIGASYGGPGTTLIETAGTDKIGVYGTVPIVRPAASQTHADVVNTLRAIGWLAPGAAATDYATTASLAAEIARATGIEGGLDTRLDAVEAAAPSYQTIANLGVTYAELVAGKVPAAQLPSYVDDVVEVANFAALPAVGESGKIYVTADDSKSYRWTGSTYSQLDAGLVLGETSATAYRGDRGKTAYDHSLLVAGNPHNVTKTDVGLSNVDNTTDLLKPISTATQTALNLKADLTAIIAKTTFDTKGDLLVATANDAYSKLAAGVDDTILMASAAAATGLKYATPLEVRTALALVIGTNVQAWDTDLDQIAGLTYAADRIAYFTGAHAAAVTPLTAAGRAIIDDADAAAQRTTLGLGTAALVADSTLVHTTGAESIGGAKDFTSAMTVQGGHPVISAAIDVNGAVHTGGGFLGLDFIGTEYNGDTCSLDTRSTQGSDLNNLSPTLLGDIMGAWHIGGSHNQATGLTDCAQIYARATQNFSTGATAAGTAWDHYITPNGTDSKVIGMTVDQDGSLEVRNVLVAGQVIAPRASTVANLYGFTGSGIAQILGAAGSRSSPSAVASLGVIGKLQIFPYETVTPAYGPGGFELRVFANQAITDANQGTVAVAYTTPNGSNVLTETQRWLSTQDVAFSQSIAVGAGSAPTWRIHLKGGNAATSGIGIDVSTTGPTAPGSSASAVTSIYKGATNWYYLITFNDAGTTRYRYMQLNGTTATWTHATTLPT